MPSISVGYSVLDAEQDAGVMRVTRWQPIELSIVSIPADASIGVSRALPTATISRQVRMARLGGGGPGAGDVVGNEGKGGLG